MLPGSPDSFDPVAEQYHRARPRYPDVLFDALAKRTGMGPGSRVLEIGAGTGQATAGLLARGAEVTAVERGPELGAVLRREFPGAALEVVTRGFEEWTLPQRPFEVVGAFTSWHWLEPRVRTDKAARALRSGGWLATVTTTHVVDEPDGFFDEVQSCYRRWTPSDARRPPRSSDVREVSDEVDDSPWFEPAELRTFTQDLVYSADAYIEVLGTYSDHLALPAADRAGLFACLSALIDDHYDGSITKRYLYRLRLARRIDRIELASGHADAPAR